MKETKEKIVAAVSLGTLLLSVLGLYVGTQVDIARMSERVDNLTAVNTQTLEVLEKLADSVDRLSLSVARLDERTKALEENGRASRENQRGVSVGE